MHIRKAQFWTRAWLAGFPILLIPVASAVAQNVAPLFTDTELLEVTITAPFEQIMDVRSEDAEHAGSLQYTETDGSEKSLVLQVRVRGKYRARKEVCDFAPLRLNFKKKEVRDTVFDGQNKVKLVTHCENAGSSHEQYIIKEYLTYQFLQAMTDLSFHTRLLRITYVDSESRSKTRTKYGFIIEHESDLSDRLDLALAQQKSVEIEQLEPLQTNLFTVFAYFIGNTDFSATLGPSKEFCCHNAVLLEPEPGLILPVPYDFDLAGMVDAPYAAPNPKYEIDEVTDRLYRGLCRDTHLLEQTLQMFTEKRPVFHSLVDEQQELRSGHKRKMKRYIDEFYRTIRDPKLIERKLIRTCAG